MVACRVGEASHPGPPRAPTAEQRATQLQALERELARAEGCARRTHGTAEQAEDDAVVEHLRQALAHVRNVQHAGPGTFKCVRCRREFRACPLVAAASGAEAAAAAAAEALQQHVIDVHLLASLKQDEYAERAPVIVKLIEQGAALRDELLEKAAADVNPARVKELLAAAGIGDTQAGTEADAKKAMATLTKATAAERVDAMFRLLLAVVSTPDGVLAAQRVVISADGLPADVHQEGDGSTFEATLLGQRLLAMPGFKDRSAGDRQMLWCTVAFAAPRTPRTRLDVMEGDKIENKTQLSKKRIADPWLLLLVGVVLGERAF